MGKRKSPDEREAEVLAACQALHDEGKSVTTSAVIDRVGGSNSSALKHIRTWKALHAKPAEGVDPILAQAYERIRKDIHASVQKELKDAIDGRQEAEARAKEAERKAEDFRRSAEDANAAAEKANHAAEAARSAEAVAIEEAQTATAKLSGSKAVLTSALSGIERASQSLHEEVHGAKSAHVRTLSHVRDIKESHASTRSLIEKRLDEIDSCLEIMAKAFSKEVSNLSEKADQQNIRQNAIAQELEAQKAALNAHTNVTGQLSQRLAAIIESAVSVDRNTAKDEILAAIEPLVEAIAELATRVSKLEQEIRRKKKVKSSG